MHKDSYRLMGEILNNISLSRPDWSKNWGLLVLDVGAFDVNGTYRPLVEGRDWRYVGLDVRPGPNVDVVADDPYHYPFDDGTFDVVISGNMMHNVAEIWRWVPELVRVLRPGGTLAIITVYAWPTGSRYPADYWRVQMDGMKLLFDLTGALEGYDIQCANEHDLVAVARKKP